MPIVKPDRWPRRFKTRRFVTLNSAVYVVAAPEAAQYKIGRAKNPEKRLLQMQTGCPLELKLMTQTFVSNVDGIDPIEFERTLHKWLKPYRIHGEWFEATRQRVILAWHQVAGELLDRMQKDKVSHDTTGNL